MTLATVDYGDVQGLVRYGYAHMTESRFLLLRVKDPRAARAWLRAAPVTPATRTTPRPATALQVAFTREGLEALGAPAGCSRASPPSSSPGCRGKRAARAGWATWARAARRPGCGAARGTCPT
jgi:hypothetical protein